MEKLRYISSEHYVEGVIVEVTDGSVAIDFKGRMGHLRLPKRNIISDYDLAIGQEVGLMMSIPEVLTGEVNEEYRRTIEHTREIQERMTAELEAREGKSEQ